MSQNCDQGVLPTTAAPPALLGLRADLRILADDDRIVLVGDGIHLDSPRAAGEPVLQLLDGSRTYDEALGEMAELHDASLAGELAERGLLVLRSDSPPPPTRAHHEFRGCTGDCDDATVSVYSVTQRTPDVDALARTGLRISLERPEAVDTRSTVAVVLCDDYLHPALVALADQFQHADIPWVPIKQSGTSSWAGPIVGVAGAPCWDCVRTRVRHNDLVSESMRAARWDDNPFIDPTAADLALALGMGLVRRVLCCGTTGQANRLHTARASSLEVEAHRVIPRDECPTCGVTDAPEVAAPRLTSTALTSYGTAGVRARSPEQTWETYRHVISPVVGIVPAVVQDQRLPGGLHSYVSGVNGAVPRGGTMRPALRWTTGGKGQSDIEARVGALCEAIERSSATYRGNEAAVVAPYAEVATRAIHPQALQLFGEEQYAAAAQWNREHSAFQRVPDRLEPSQPISWSRCWSLTDGTEWLSPTGLTYLNGPDQRLLVGDSNGCASGSSREDATIQALLEVIERDAVSIWWYNQLRRPAVPLDRLASPWIRRARAAFHDMGRDLWVLDLTHDLGIPVAAAVSRLKRPHPSRGEGLVFGFGAHLRIDVAVTRAVSEMVQFVGVVDQVRDPQAWVERDPDFARWLCGARLAEQQYLAPQGETTPADVGLSSSDALAQVDHLVSALRRRGLDTYLVDQTRRETGMPVVRVLVPGARHLWRRTAPGRLVDVPVAMGDVAAPLAVSELNPFVMFA